MQQATIAMPANSPVRAMTGLARQIALPAEHAPQRFPSFPALERTAVMAFSQPNTITVGPSTTATHVMVTRQAAYPVWSDIPLPDSTTNSVITYAVQYQCSAAVAAVGSPLSTEATVLECDGLYSGNITKSGGNIGISGANPYMSWPIIGLDKDLSPSLPFVYIPPHFSSQIVGVLGNSVTGNTSVVVTMEEWNCPARATVGEPSGDLTFSFNIPNSYRGSSAGISSANFGRWVRPRNLSMQYATATSPVQIWLTLVVSAGSLAYSPGTSDAGQMAVNPNGVGTGFLPIFTPNEFATSPVPWQDTRVTAVSVLASNVTQVLNKGGTVLAGRIQPAQFGLGPWRVSQVNVQALHPAEKAWLPLETGFYTYAPPSTAASDFYDYCFTGPYGTSKFFSSSLTQVPVYRLDDTSLVNHAYFTTVGGVSETLAVTSTVHFEFRTTSSLFQLALSGLTLESLHAAQITLASAGFFFENPTHKSVLQHVLNAVKRTAPVLLGALPEPWRSVSTTVANAIPWNRYKDPGPPKTIKIKPPRPAMKPTSAQASGIVPSKKRKGRKAVIRRQVKLVRKR